MSASATPLVAVVGLGANLGDRLATLRSAMAALGRFGVVEAVSRIYESDPVGVTDQPAFLNAAARMRYDAGADAGAASEALLDALLSVELAHGRVRRERWGPRTLDLDVLYVLGRVVRTARLEVPHPLLHERAFAVVPLLEVLPGAIDPRTGQVYEIPPRDQGGAGGLRVFDAIPLESAGSAR